MTVWEQLGDVTVAIEDGIAAAASWSWEWLLRPAWDWTWEHGLDGIGAGILGGVVAAYLLSRTIRHEEKQKADAAAEARKDELLLALRRLHFALSSVDDADIAKQRPGEDLHVALRRATRAVRAEILFARVAARAASEVRMSGQLDELRVALGDALEPRRGKLTAFLSEYRVEAEEVVLAMIARLLADRGAGQQQ